MKRKIFYSFLAVFIISALGSTFAILYIRNTTATLGRLISLHEGDSLHHRLILSIQAVQSELPAILASSGRTAGLMAAHATDLEQTSQKCSTCHHGAAITKQINRIQSLVGDYGTALDRAVTVPAGSRQVRELKLAAAAIGNELLVNTEGMSAQAGKKLKITTQDAMLKIKWAWLILTGTLIVTLVLGVTVAVNLTAAITRPIDTLVNATRMIASGNLGYTIAYRDKTEFGELAAHFNAMSGSLLSGYTKLEKEITERRQAEEALRESEERYALAARGANDGMWDWDLRNGNVYYSVRWKSMLGYGEDELANRPEEWLGRIHPDDREEVEARLAAHLNGRNPYFECEYRVMHKDGAYRWVLNRGLAVRAEEGRAHRMAGSQTDITSRKKAEEQLVYDAFHDALTGLPNRALFLDRLQHVIAASHRRKGALYAVLFLDMDRFKIINDSLGHSVGDQLLIAVGRRLAECIRPGDTVARLGGDEFAVLLGNISELAHAIDVVGRINKKLDVSLDIMGNEIFTSVSIGIAVGADRYERPEQVLRDADIAMYEAKARGNSCYEVFDSKMHANILDRLQLEADLRGALDRKELVLYYQPIIDLKTQRLTGCEALVRWRHPKRGLIYPMEFIPLAEENGLIYPIGEWIIHEACRELNTLQERYPAQPPLKMSINISGKQFTRKDLVSKLAGFLRETAVKPGSLALEITESMIMENVEAAVETMNQIRGMGVQLHIDDFGTGYSSLSYLHRFPVNALKIDGSFIKKLTADGANREIILSIISLAKSMNFDVIAEGVELEHQLANIKEMQCAYGQGFLFAHPMNMQDIGLWLEDRNDRALPA
jgi:diguanylate cyclase (GGDEF)-like protein/PAS domain S-box-containing protein